MRCRGNRIVFVHFTNPGAYPPITNAARILSGRGWSVTMVGAVVQTLEQLKVPTSYRISSTLVPMQDRLALQYGRFVLRSIREVMLRRPQWVYCSDLSSTPIGLIASVLPWCRVVYHEHDLPVSPKRSRAVTVLMRLRRQLLERADLVVVPNAGRRRAIEVAMRRPRPVCVVMNTPLREDLSSVEPQLEFGSLRLLFQGAVTPARLPLSLVEALVEVQGAELTVVGYGTTNSPDHPQAVLRAAERFGVADRVRITGAMSHSEVLALTPDHDIGIVLLEQPPAWDDNLNSLFGASNKIFEYLGTGLAVLTILTPDLLTNIVDTGYGVGCPTSDVEAIRQALTWILAHREEVAAMGRRGREAVEREWNYEVSFAPVLAVLTVTSRG